VSKCFTCCHARKPWSEILLSQGWVGCACQAKLTGGVQIESGSDIVIAVDAETIGSGWVRMRVPLHFKEDSFFSGLLNNQLLVKNATNCSHYEEEKEETVPVKKCCPHCGKEVL